MELDRALKGFIFSHKMNTNIPYANEMELIITKWLDTSTEVIQFFYENLSIPYTLGGKVHFYHPDFEVMFRGYREIWELKYQLKHHKDIVKARAAEKYAKEHGYKQYRVIEKNDIEEFI
jgi:hypothetical protein